MADLICPACGKPNPDGSSVCQFCEKPLGAEEISGFGPAGESMEDLFGGEKGIPDWVTQLEEESGITVGSAAASSTPAPAQGEAEPADLPDWLSSLAPSQDGSPARKPAQASADLPDWLNSLGAAPAEEAPAAPTEEPALPAEDLPDWLGGMVGEPSSIGETPAVEALAGGEVPAAPAEEPALPVEDLPDWLGGLGAATTEEALAAPAEEPALPAEDLPDWLGGMVGEPSSVGETPAAPTEEPTLPAEDLPDWLGGLGAAPAQEVLAAPAEEPARPAEDLPDWLGGLGAAPAQEVLAAPAEGPALPAEDLPDWLGGMLEESPTAEAPAAPTEEPALPAEDLPDWLGGMVGEPSSVGETPAVEALAGGEVPAAPAEEPALPAEDLPDWLGGLGAAPVEEAPAGGEAPAAASEDDWFASLSEKASLPEEPAAPAEDLPDWLGGLGAAPAEGATTGDEVPAGDEAPAAPTEETAQPAQDMPDWLTGLGAGLSAAFAADSAGQEAPDSPDWLQGETVPSPFTSESAPDWLSSEQPGKPAAGEPGPAEPTPASEIPDWLAGVTPLGGAEPPAASTPAFTFEEQPSASEAGPEGESHYLAALPDWVSNVSAEEAETAEPDAGLKPADLPDWLEAMRPVGTGVASGPVEDVSGANLITAGPLAGLRGVLDAEPDATRTSKPAAYSLKLHINEAQQARIEMLKSLLESEQQAKPLPTKASFQPQQYLVRILVALALLVPLFWIVSTNGREVALPKPGSLPAVTDLQQLLGTIQNDSPVLVAFDYEPGFSGEMNLVASSVLRRLADQGAYLALASTSPTGPALAEVALAALSEERSPVSNYANLGYIAGGPAGLRLLSDQPNQVLAYDLKGNYAWKGTPLEAVNTLADFRMILILTDDADTARAWIEQVGPGLQERGTPLVMLVSAQIEPMVRPYYESSPRQVAALVGGLPGGAAFENATGYTGPARNTWDAFSLGLMISAVIILVGALFSVTAKTVASSRAAKK